MIFLKIYNFLYAHCVKLKTGTEELTYGRKVILQFIKEIDYLHHKKQINILDIGCGKGDDLENIKSLFSNTKTSLFGFEICPQNQEICRKKGIKNFGLNLEKDIFPFENNSIDLVICNQVIEHVKNHFWLVSEIHRVLHTKGSLIMGIPNLAAYHDRIILMLGHQPSSIRVIGPHVRGFTPLAFKEFMEDGNYFSQEKKLKGSGFFPFSWNLSIFLSRIFPNSATAIFFRFSKTNKKGSFIKNLTERFFETNYYDGKK